LVSGRSCIVYQTLKKLGMQNIDFVGNVIQQCIKYSMSPSKIIAGFFQEARPVQKSAEVNETNKPAENKEAKTDKETEQPDDDKSGRADGNNEPQPTLKNYNCLFVGKRQTYAQLRYLLEQGYTFVGDEQVNRIFYCAQVPYTGYERQVINVVKLFSDAQSDLKPLTFDFLAWYYLWRNDSSNQHANDPNTTEFKRYLADTLIRSKVALKLYNKYKELIDKKGRMQFRLHDLRELLQVGINLNWQIPG